MIKYQSTRGSADKKTAAQAVIKGIAEDKGLYVPDSIPALPETVKQMTGRAEAGRTEPVQRRTICSRSAPTETYRIGQSSCCSINST